MCQCPTHIVETASQLASFASSYGPFAGLIPAAILGGKFGQLLLRLVAKFSFVAAR